MPRFLLVLLLVAVAACYRASETELSAPCNGTRFVVVSNNWNRAIDVYAYQNGQANVLGTVTAGSRGEFPVPSSPSSINYRAEGGGGVVPERATSPVQMRYICR